MTDRNDPQTPGGHHTDSRTTVREVHTERRSGGSMPFILGGVVVAVLVIGWVLFSGGGEVAETDGGDVNVSIEGSAEEATQAAEDAAERGSAAVEEAAEDAGAAVEDAAEDAGAAVEGAAEEAAEETQ